MSITLKPRGEARIRNGHPGCRSDIGKVAAGPGAVVQVTGARDVTLGYGLYSDRSEIALRMLTRERERRRSIYGALEWTRRPVTGRRLASTPQPIA